MPLAGMGYGAAKTLEDLVAEQMLRQKLAAEIKAQEDALSERKRASMADESARTRQLDLTERQLNMPPKPERDPLADYEARKQIDQKYMPPMKVERDPLQDYEARKQIDRRYDKPPGPQAPPEQTWVVRNGKIVPIRKGTTQAGDQPYDEVKARQEAGAQTPSPYSIERAARTVQAVDELMGQVNHWTAGVGSLLAKLPESAARDFATQLNTLKSNIMLNELSQMRASSKTGGALGQVSDREGQLLQDALGGLDPGQKPEQLIGQLKKVRDSITRWQQAQGVSQTGGPIAPVSSHAAPIEYVRDASGKLVRKP